MTYEDAKATCAALEAACDKSLREAERLLAKSEALDMSPAAKMSRAILKVGLNGLKRDRQRAFREKADGATPKANVNE